MKFELKPNNRNVSNEDIIDDVKSVAKKLKQTTLSQKDYKQYGRFSCSTVTRKLGPWVKVLELADLKISNYHKIENPELLEDLVRVAKQIGRKTVSQPEYKIYGKYSSDPFKDHFGSWNSALQEAGLEKSKNADITTDQLFENLEEIWTKLGRQPNYGEVAKPLSKYSKDCYSRRFGSWRKALESFVISVNSNESKTFVEEKHQISISPPESRKELLQHKTKRGINWRLRFLVMRRDSFKCRSCGRSPATNLDIVLHVDHIHAWANGGETVPENLQTLCSKCNIGKSDLE